MDICLVTLCTLCIQKILLSITSKVNNKKYKFSERHLLMLFLENAIKMVLEKRKPFMHKKEVNILRRIEHSLKIASVVPRSSCKTVYINITNPPKSYHTLNLNHYNFVIHIKVRILRKQYICFRKFRESILTVPVFIYTEMLVHIIVLHKFCNKRKSTLFLSIEHTISYLKWIQITVQRTVFIQQRSNLNSYIQDAPKQKFFFESLNKMLRKNFKKKLICIRKKIILYKKFRIIYCAFKPGNFSKHIKILQSSKFASRIVEFFQLYRCIFQVASEFVFCLLKHQIKYIFNSKNYKNLITRPKYVKYFFLLANEPPNIASLITYVYSFILQISRFANILYEECFYFTSSKVYIVFIFKKTLLICFLLLLIGKNTIIVCAIDVSQVQDIKENISSAGLPYSNTSEKLLNHQKNNVFAFHNNSLFSSYKMDKDVNDDNASNGPRLYSSETPKNAFKLLLYYNIISSKGYKRTLKYNFSLSCIKNLVYQMAEELTKYPLFTSWNTSHLRQRLNSKNIYVRNNRYLHRYIILLINFVTKYANDRNMFEKHQINVLATTIANYLTNPLIVNRS